MLRRLSSFGKKKSAAAEEEGSPEAPKADAPPADDEGSLCFAGVQVRALEADPRWAGRAMPELLSAAKACDLPRLTRLLSAPGCDPDVGDDGAGGETALHLAAEEGHTAAVALLLERGASVNATNHDGWRPIHTAAQCEAAGGTDTVALLLLRGADVHAVTKIRATPLHVAAFNGRLGATKALLARGADVHASQHDGLTPLDDARHRSTSCPCTSEDRERKWGAVIKLLEKVAPMDEAERLAFARRSWLLDAAAALEGAALRGEVAELERLLRCYGKEGADAPDHDGARALHMAAEGGAAPAVEALLRARADPRATNGLGETPLHVAAREGHLAAARMLVARGADVRAATLSGAAPRDHATRGQSRDWEAVVALLDAAAGAESPRMVALKAMLG